MRPSLVIVGLGNPGASYERTRHNAGFRAADLLGERFGEGEWKEHQKFLALSRTARIGAVEVLLLKPQTFMNRSGESVRKVVDFYKLTPAQQLLVLCDDVDLPLGELWLRRTGGPGTHNGLKSIVEVIGEAFARIRIGFGAQPAGADLAAWGLSVPSKEEVQAVDVALEKIPEMVEGFVKG
ncbi:MAG: aminoacyl-tRNA hydrolase, partial [Candidatus Peribacteraceae bacterium]|nr:aminoacyl-tRNA hydrolase [Candidatus Peribacteraceae bacterium]